MTSDGELVLIHDHTLDPPEIYDLAISRGAMVFTSNDPKWAIEYLRSKGLHN